MDRLRRVMLGAVCMGAVAVASCGGSGDGSSNPTQSLNINTFNSTPDKAYNGYAVNANVEIFGSVAVAGGPVTSLRLALIDGNGRTALEATPSVAPATNPIPGVVGYSVRFDPSSLAAGTYTFQVTALGSGTTSAPASKAFTVIRNPYTPLASMPTTRFDFAVAAANGRIYAMTGSLGSSTGGAATAVVEVFDPTTNTWLAGPSAPTSRIGATATSVGSRIYLLGGYNATNPTGLRTVDVFDAASGTWTTTTTAAPTARFFAGATSIGTDVYLFGGTQDPRELAPLATLERLNTVTGQWTSLTPTGGTATSHPSLVTLNGKVYSLGGIRGFIGSIFSAVMSYDPATNTWTDGPPMIYGRIRFAAVSYSGALYGFGGTTNNGSIPDPPTDKTESIVPPATAWTVKAPLPGGAVQELGGAVVGDSVYLVGSMVTYRYPPGADVP